MRLGTLQSSFVFSLPLSFLKPEIITRYDKILEKNHIQYDSVLDYLNSTIKSINTPGLSIETPMQHTPRGKERYYKPATNIQDIISSREINITFKSVDSNLNYFILYDIFSKHYIDVDNLHIDPFKFSCVDIFRDEIYTITYKEIILKSMSDMLHDYSTQKISQIEFTISFMFNVWDIEFTLDKGKVLEVETVPTIIQKI